MKKSSDHFVMFGVEELLQQVGQNIKTARIRRNITIKELANQFPDHCHVAIIRSYVHKAKIAEDITDALMKIAATHS